MDTLTIAGKTFTSRLVVGTGKYSSPAVMVKAHEASGAEMITVAVRRVNISDRSSARGPREHSESSSGAARASGGGAPRAVKEESLLDYIDTSKNVLLPYPSGC